MLCFNWRREDFISGLHFINQDAYLEIRRVWWELDAEEPSEGILLAIFPPYNLKPHTVHLPPLRIAVIVDQYSRRVGILTNDQR